MTTYAKPENLIEITAHGIRQAHPDISFPPSIEPHHVADLGYLPIEIATEPELQDGEELQPGELEYDADENRIIRQWIVIPAPPVDPGMLIQQNNYAYEAATTALTADYPQLEKDTWPTQDKESAAWLADPANATTTFLTRAAANRGIEREDYIRRTIQKAHQFVIMSSYLTGRRQGYEDQIKAGGNPVLDFTLSTEVLAKLQQISDVVWSTSAEGLKAALEAIA